MFRTFKDDQHFARNISVRAPCCGRKVAADMLINVTGLPTELRSAHPRSGNSSGVADYLCDGCRERLFLTGKLTREAWVKYFNAPAELVAKMRALDSALGRRR